MAREPTLDVYARPFIPNILKAINQLPATVVLSAPVRWIDFPAYVSTFAGSTFLLADPPAPDLGEAEGPPGAGNADSLGDCTSEPDPSHYYSCFRNALVKEASALESECEGHALYRVPLAEAFQDPRPQMYTLYVPGLRELSLRIEIGDIVRLRQLHFGPQGELLEGPSPPQHNSLPPAYQHHQNIQHDSVVWGIDRLREALILRVNALAPRSMLFNVCFTVQAGRLGALYRAVTNTQKALSVGHHTWMRSMLFPNEPDGELQTTLNKGTIGWLLRDEMLNYEQIRAVDTILAGKYGRVPYLISGPPGTGKTKTIVETAVQLTVAKPAAHLLLCAPSDPAADTLVQRLSKYFAPNQMLRLQAPSRNFPEVPGTVLPFCYVDQDIFSLPPFRQMMQYRIVVTTCRDSEIMLRARLSNADLCSLQQGISSAIHPEQTAIAPQLHWSGLLVDEAAQATEPEALIPICVVAPPENFENRGLTLPIFVMAGDQNQLAPRTASKAPTLQRSLFERLGDRPLYREHLLARSKQNRGIMRPLTQDMLPIIRPPFANLIRNYRSHSAILATPSASFYHDTLEPDAGDVDNLLTWSGWRGRRWPVLFVENHGNDEIEQDGGGWYNRSEASMACMNALSFVQDGLLNPEDICIMSPFHAQVRVLRNVARSPQFNLHRVNIGPLEAYQGLESTLVILCTTRTRDRFIEQDLAKGSGVIHEPRRFNVALTRAKHGLIVIGNPTVLEHDRNWRVFLSFCSRNGLWQGEGRKKAEEYSTIISRLEKQLKHREDQTNGITAAQNGMRKLGLSQNVDDNTWESGLAAESALQHAEDPWWAAEE